MLHEVLLALCGYPSPLFETNGVDAFPLVTPAETALLRRLGRLAGLNRALRSHITRLVQIHEVFVCKAVATAIRQNYLSKFQKHVLQVEQQILSKDASTVGAYNIVPLASLLGEFEPWMRTLEWLWDLSCFILPEEAHADAVVDFCSSADLLERLRQDSLTGYPDIRAAALDLLAVAESAWLRQLVQWLLQTAHGMVSSSDFFIETAVGPSRALALTVVSKRAPSFVTDASAESILYLGKILSYMSRDWTGRGGSSTASRPKLNTLDLAEHFRRLTALNSPVASTSLASAISDIRTSLSTQVVYKLLPVHMIISTIGLMREFFLLGKPSFADALVGESESVLQLRSAHTSSQKASAMGTSLADITLKESEVSQIMARTLASLAPWIGKEASLDTHMEWARENLRLQIVKEQGNTNESPFHDLLLGTPASLTLQLRPPLDLFLRPQDLEDYSSMHTYLVSIRRGQLHLAETWRQTALRKEHPCPRGDSESAASQRLKFQSRMRHLRSVWHTMNTAHFALTELGNYMVVEVVGQSWTKLMAWIQDDFASEAAVRPVSGSSNTRPSTSHSGTRPDSQGNGLSHESTAPRDPEILSLCHRKYMQSLKRSLLLEDAAYTRALRAVLSHVDYLRATVDRVLELQRRVDLMQGQQGALNKEKQDHGDEEWGLTEDAVHAAKQLDQDVKTLVAQLQAINVDSSKSGSADRDTVLDAVDFVPWNGGSLDRLLMRLNLSPTA